MKRSVEDFELLSADDAESRYELSHHITYQFREYADDQEQRLYDGGLRLGATLTSSRTRLTPNVIVDGDLEVDGTIDWHDDLGCYVLVTGNLRCKNLIVSGSIIVVLGDLVVENTIAGLPSDSDHCGIIVHGTTRAKLVVGEAFAMHFGVRPDAVVCGAPEQYAYLAEDAPDEFEVDFAAADLAKILVPEALYGECQLHGYTLRQMLLAGGDVMRA